MAQYRISGVWKDEKGTITHYAFHTKTDKGYTRSKKLSKSEAVTLLSSLGNTAMTWLWNYRTSFWMDGENVEVVNGSTGKYLRSNPDNTTTDNLAHLIDYDWL